MMVKETSGHNVISLLAESPPSVRTADLDGDGDLDLISASDRDKKIAWYENLGQGIFGVQQILSDSADGAQSVHAADLDLDGDLDILSGSYFDGKIAWYENYGSGVFSPEIIISTMAEGAVYVTAGDLDGDGDLDVMSASMLDDKVAWYENLSVSNCEVPQALDVVEIGFGGPNPRVNATWINPSSTLDCRVRAGQISNTSANGPSPVFYKMNNTIILNNTTGTSLNSNVRLYNNPSVNIIPGAYYGYEVQCKCLNDSDYSFWSGLRPSSVFRVPLLSPEAQVESNDKALTNQKYAVTLFPNPFSVSARIDLNGWSGKVNVEVFNSFGQRLRSEVLFINDGPLESIELRRNDLKEGFYFLHVTSDKGSLQTSFVIE
ncbi:MAG: T9SS type A sorting domain-containing protein [Bacteroidetes bacterium]|nr:T9SS type A sorting domain-containing protein [Bacteroidota bacterium]MDA0972300.1 T9SS type A sorting domain-containing protein [Bacteroidota bacterium]